MRKRRGLLVPGLLKALLLWGYFYEAPDERRPFMIGAELAWVRAFDTWLFDVSEAVDKAESTTDLAKSDVLDKLHICIGVENRVPSAPTERLARIRNV